MKKAASRGFSSGSVQADSSLSRFRACSLDGTRRPRLPCSLDPSKDNKTQSEKLTSSDELYCRSIYPLKEPGYIVAVLDFCPDQHYVRPPHIETHNRPLGARLLTDNKENWVRSQFPDCQASLDVSVRVPDHPGPRLGFPSKQRPDPPAIATEATRSPGPLSTL